ncbi:unnamed protein product [Gongylonema pulchrum]|uniref:Uncharacterized protein n=1 Tax=Gongylonema pulchrum TaxID=637853 RepID=A0A3P6Q7J8_9BILA|nr:unnamed protein product [Gongylonema pulchrum]
MQQLLILVRLIIRKNKDSESSATSSSNDNKFHIPVLLQLQQNFATVNIDIYGDYSLFHVSLQEKNEVEKGESHSPDIGRRKKSAAESSAGKKQSEPDSQGSSASKQSKTEQELGKVEAALIERTQEKDDDTPLESDKSEREAKEAKTKSDYKKEKMPVDVIEVPCGPLDQTQRTTLSPAKAQSPPEMLSGREEKANKLDCSDKQTFSSFPAGKAYVPLTNSFKGFTLVLVLFQQKNGGNGSNGAADEASESSTEEEKTEKAAEKPKTYLL